MTKKMLIDAAHAGEVRVVILEDGELYDYDFVSASKTQLKGNIFLAKITRVEPSLQAAFVEYGGNRQGFLPFSEIHPDYYQLPQDDKRKLLEEQIAEAEAEEAAEEEAFEREQAAREAREQTMDAAGSLETMEEAASDGLIESFDTEEPRQHSDVEITDIRDDSQSIAFQPLSSESFAISSELLDEPFPTPDETDADSSGNTTDTIAESAQALTKYGDVERAEIAAVVEQSEETEAVDSSVASDVETISGDEVAEERKQRRNNARSFLRRYRIQEVIKRNQIVLVQVTKEERGNKGCSLTTYVSLAGRYCVLMPNSPKGGGISRKITDRTTRKRLKEVLGEMRTHRGMSVIIRTAGIDRSRPEIRRDYEYLVQLWNQIREQTLSSNAPSMIYEESDLIKRAIRDLYTNDIEEIIVDGADAFEEAKTFMNLLMPTHATKVHEHKDMLPLFAAQSVEDMLQEMVEPQVRLPSGGYLVINPTEALISIDVNSGRSTTERNVEETAVKTNVEAAIELARQLRLRDLAGLIVVDFIDMNFHKNRRTVERAMRDALREDRAKIQLGRISTFGLMELSRQRMRPSISEAMGNPCPHCKGTGHIHSVETVGIQIIRTLEKEAASGDFVTLRVSTYDDVALHLLNDMRAMLQSLEARYNVKVLVLIDTSILSGNYRLIKINAEGKEIAHETTRAPRKRSRRSGGGAQQGNRRPPRPRDGDARSSEQNDTETDADFAPERTESRSERSPSEAAEPSETQGENGEERPRRNRRGQRGKRGGRNKPRGERGERPDNRRERSDSASTQQGDASEPSAQTSTVIQMHEPAKAVPSPSASRAPLPDTVPNDDGEGKPKRKGWWNRVLEN
jgi:ribonuclease E